MSRPTVNLRRYDNRWYRTGGSLLRRSLWFFLGHGIVRSAWIPSSALRVAVLRLFGASIGQRVVIKPSVEVKYPWHLSIGDDCWIGEHVWIDNLTTVKLGNSVCISQGAYLCTGNHDWSDPAFGLRISPIHLADGAWAGARCILLPGTTLETCAVAAAGSVVHGSVPAYQIFAGNPAVFLRQRVIRDDAPATTSALDSTLDGTERSGVPSPTSRAAMHAEVVPEPADVHSHRQGALP